ncbi:flagellar filament capping protein FliD [Pseudomonas sp. S31]|uniref:flagellar filament capping protein FliD n=1 Tax=Pseudomonas sp. S31 TaxID=1564473 RepID=UPI0019119FAB|nr:flagellar filament capping protein FliD [Pseudomonas sp. S31]MBK5000683.1 flagellar filament capping protein FliD [Pseudomonas sp. S31]
MGTSVNGVGSGIDIDSIVSALVSAQKAPKQSQIDTATTKATTSLSAIGTLKSALSKFQTAMSDLAENSSFTGMTAKSSNEEALTAKVGAGAASGTYVIKTTSIATSSKVATQYISTGTTFGAGTFTISQGAGAASSASTTTIKVASGATLSDIRDSINTQLKDSGITANIISDSEGQRLVLSSTNTGEGTDITLTTNSTALSALGIAAGAKASDSTGGYVVEPAADAVYTIDGLSMKSATNEITTAISGVEFTLLEDDTKSTITVDTNTDGLKESITSFVDAYNSLMSSIKTLTTVTSGTDDDGNATTTAAALTSDSSVRNIVNSLRNQLVSSSGDGGTLKLLSQLGVSTQNDGTLSIDEDDLEAALEKNAASVESFFTGTNGLLSRMSSTLDLYVADDGLLDQRTDSLNDTLSDLATQQTNLDRRITKYEATMYAKYNAMDTLVAQLTATSTSVMTTLNALNNASSDD